MSERRPRAPGRRRWLLEATAASAIFSASLLGCHGRVVAAAEEGGAAGFAVLPVPEGGARTAVDVAAMFATPKAPPTQRENLGRQIFFDTNLSTPPGTSCASCHDPLRAFSGNHGSTHGVAAGSRPGHFARRNTPSVLYLKYVPAFHFAFADDDDLAPSPFAGLTWSGRADSVAEFSRSPLFDPNEMNSSEGEIRTKLRGAPYTSAFTNEFPGALETPAGAVGALGQALEAYLTSDAMAPFTSRFDDYLRGTGKLSPLEQRGLDAFKSSKKGACDACHRFVESSKRTSRSMFTNYGYDAVAVPRNRDIPANSDPAYHDVGLCERTQTDKPSSAPQWCVQFRTPSLRNVAVRERFMHNGAFSKLRDVVAFYNTRGITPSRWYSRGDKFDDVPAKYRGNVNVMSLPYNRAEGEKPPMDDEDIDAIVAFLETLTDEPYRGALSASR
jgi:cytochrome c peroxidase